MPIREIAYFLGRTEASVRGHADMLELSQSREAIRRDLYLDPNGQPTAEQADRPLKIAGVLQPERLSEYLKEQYRQGRSLNEVASDLEVSPTTLSRWNTKLGLYPQNQRGAPEGFDLGQYLAQRPTPGHAIFEAFLAGQNKLPRNKYVRGDPGQKLSSALARKKPAQALINEIPEALRLANPQAVEEFRRQYEDRLAVPLRDFSKKPGHAIFEAFLANENKLPPKKDVKGDPGEKLSKALAREKPAQALIEEIPEALRLANPQAIEEFLRQYERRLTVPLLDLSKKAGHAIFEAFLAGENKLPPLRKIKGDPGKKLSAALSRKKPAQALIEEIPEALRLANPQAVEEFRRQYEDRLAVPLLDRSKKPGHAIFEAFTANENKLPPQKPGKGDPGAKLQNALASEKPAQALIEEIPEALRLANPQAVEEFRRQYESRLESRRGG